MQEYVVKAVAELFFNELKAIRALWKLAYQSGGLCRALTSGSP